MLFLLSTSKTELRILPNLFYFLKCDKLHSNVRYLSNNTNIAYQILSKTKLYEPFCPIKSFKRTSEENEYIQT